MTRVARIQEGVGALAGYGEIFYRNTIALGRDPSDFLDPRSLVPVVPFILRR